MLDVRLLDRIFQDISRALPESQECEHPEGAFGS